MEENINMEIMENKEIADTPQVEAPQTQDPKVEAPKAEEAVMAEPKDHAYVAVELPGSKFIDMIREGKPEHQEDKVYDLTISGMYVFKAVNDLGNNIIGRVINRVTEFYHAQQGLKMATNIFSDIIAQSALAIPEMFMYIRQDQDYTMFNQILKSIKDSVVETGLLKPVLDDFKVEGMDIKLRGVSASYGVISKGSLGDEIDFIVSQMELTKRTVDPEVYETNKEDFKKMFKQAYAVLNQGGLVCRVALTLTAPTQKYLAAVKHKLDANVK